MRESARRLLVGLVVVAVIGIIPLIALASNGNGSTANPTVTHGPKRTPTPTRIRTPLRPGT